MKYEDLLALVESAEGTISSVGAISSAPTVRATLDNPASDDAIYVNRKLEHEDEEESLMKKNKNRYGIEDEEDTKEIDILNEDDKEDDKDDKEDKEDDNKDKDVSTDEEDAEDDEEADDAALQAALNDLIATNGDVSDEEIDALVRSYNSIDKNEDIDDEEVTESTIVAAKFAAKLKDITERKARLVEQIGTEKLEKLLSEYKK